MSSGARPGVGRAGRASLRLPPPGGRGRGTLALGNSKKQTPDPAPISTLLASPSFSPRPGFPAPQSPPFPPLPLPPCSESRVPPFPSPSLPPSAALALPHRHLSAYPLALDFVRRGLWVPAPSPTSSRAPDDSRVPTSGRAPATPNFSQLNFPPRRRQARPLRARPPAHRARPRPVGGGSGGRDPGAEARV